MNCLATFNSQPPQSRQYQASAEVSPQLTLFCDFDGPIVDVSDRYYSTYQLALVETQAFYQDQGIPLSIQILSKQQFWQMKQNRVPDVEIASRSGLDARQTDIFLKHVLQLVNQPDLLHKDKMQPGVNWGLALLHSQGVQLVLVTLRCQTQVKQILQNYGLLRLFSGIYGADDIQAAYKNYAELKTQLLEQAITELSQRGTIGAAQWMIGDTEADILAGQSLSIPTIALTCGIRSPQLLQPFHPTLIQRDLLSAAHYLLKVAQLVTV